jgi:hypothetical protein
MAHLETTDEDETCCRNRLALHGVVLPPRVIAQVRTCPPPNRCI